MKQIEQSEFISQAMLFRWARLLKTRYRELELMFAIHNGLKLNPIQANKAIASGTNKGIPDLMLPIARNGKYGLFIEMKKSTGVVSFEQKEKLFRLQEEGYKTIVCRSYDEAKNAICEYLGIKE